MVGQAGTSIHWQIGVPATAIEDEQSVAWPKGAVTPTILQRKRSKNRAHLDLERRIALKTFQITPVALRTVEQLFEIDEIKRKLNQYMDDNGDFTIDELASFMGASPQDVANVFHDCLSAPCPVIAIVRGNGHGTELEFRRQLDSEKTPSLDDHMRFRYVRAKIGLPI